MVLSYHSLEDRLVKQEFRRLAGEGVVQVLTRKVICPSRRGDCREPAGAQREDARGREARKDIAGGFGGTVGIMTEFHTVKRIDNSRLVRPVASGRLREMARLIGLGALLAAAWSSSTPGSTSNISQLALPAGIAEVPALPKPPS